MSKQSSKKSSRKEARRQELAAQKKRRQLQIGIPVAIVAALIIGLAVYRVVQANIDGVTKFGAQSRGHDTGVVIETGELPPVGGIHDPTWQTCGIYEQEVEVKNALHSMEHGAVWIAYRPSLPTSDVAALQDLVRGKSYLLMSPYTNLRSPIVLTAWGIQLEITDVNDERIAQFIDVYRAGPQSPEPGATCEGGVGSPLG